MENQITWYPWAKMNPGDSFLAPVRPWETNDQARARVASCAISYARRRNQNYVVSTRNQFTHGEEGIRVWRVK
jgi:hypothetical protein